MDCPIFAGRHAAAFFESGQKIGQGAKAGGKTCVGYAKSVGKQSAGIADPQLLEPLDVCFTGDFAEQFAEVGRVKSGLFGKPGQGDRLPEVQLQVQNSPVDTIQVFRLDGILKGGSAAAQQAAEQIFAQLLLTRAICLALMLQQAGCHGDPVIVVTVELKHPPSTGRDTKGEYFLRQNFFVKGDVDQFDGGVGDQFVKICRCQQICASLPDGIFGSVENVDSGAGGDDFDLKIVMPVDVTFGDGMVLYADMLTGIKLIVRSHPGIGIVYSHRDHLTGIIYGILLVFKQIRKNSGYM